MTSEPMRRGMGPAAGLAIMFAAVLLLAPAGRRIDLAHAAAAPSVSHWLGTDALGRDLLARIVVAAPLSIALALAAVTVATAGGVLIGGACAIGSARSRRWSASALAILLSFPSMLVALVIVMLIGAGGLGAALAIGIAMIPGFARAAQVISIDVADADYIAAARLLGVSPARRLVRHLLPNIAGPLAVKAAADTGQALVIVAGFSFLGFGVQAPGYDWGRMLAQGLKSLYVTPLPALAPGIAIALTGLAFNVLCDRLGGTQAKDGSRIRPRMPAPPPVTTTDVAGDPALVVRNLDLCHAGGVILTDVSLDIRRGEIFGLVGESGSGKTSLALAIAGLNPATTELRADDLAIAGRDVRAMKPAARGAWAGRRTGFVFQDALSAFNPMMAIGRQIAERLEIHAGRSRRQASVATVSALAAMGLSDPARQAAQRPSALSGGMRQRALIAMGLVTAPDLLIADEPTTALDTVVQAQVLDLLRGAAEDGCAILFVSHDLPVVARFCTRVAVLYAGRIVEVIDPARLVPQGPAHPYTRELVRCVPGQAGAGRLATIPGIVSGADAAAPGCAFFPRCPSARARCRDDRPPLRPFATGRIACWYPAGGEADA